MEDVLEVYQRRYDENHPLVCLDEGSKQFEQELRQALPMEPGKVKREDYEYEHEGFCSIFLACEPLLGKRVVQVRERRTKADFAHFLHEVVQVHYPQAEKITLVMDNLNTHTMGALYDTFPASEAMSIWKKLEIHYTPKHGSPAQHGRNRALGAWTASLEWSPA
jgi:hypothetical protein